VPTIARTLWRVGTRSLSHTEPVMGRALVRSGGFVCARRDPQPLALASVSLASWPGVRRVHKGIAITADHIWIARNRGKFILITRVEWTQPVFVWVVWQ
jgi:hypothetical protein